MGNCMHGGAAKNEDRSIHTAYKNGNVYVITSQENWDSKISEASKTGKTVVANFSAEWCGPCRMIATLYNELSQKYTNMIFLIVDVDELSDFSASWDIHATPTFIFFRDGKQMDKLVGANKPELQKKITEFAHYTTP